MKRYDDVIEQYLSARHAKVITSRQESDSAQVIYCILHKKVIREGATKTNLGVVFGASSPARGCRSLNECPVTVPNLITNLQQVLLRFKWFSIAVAANIEKAFLQINIREEDGDACRFLWFAEEPSFLYNKKKFESGD